MLVQKAAALGVGAPATAALAPLPEAVREVSNGGSVGAAEEKASPTYAAAVVSTLVKKMDEVQVVPGAKELAVQVITDVLSGRGALETTVTRLVRLLDKPPRWWMGL